MYIPPNLRSGSGMSGPYFWRSDGPCHACSTTTTPLPRPGRPSLRPLPCNNGPTPGTPWLPNEYRRNFLQFPVPERMRRISLKQRPGANPILRFRLAFQARPRPFPANPNGQGRFLPLPRRRKPPPMTFFPKVRPRPGLIRNFITWGNSPGPT